MSALDNGASYYQVVTNSAGSTFTNVPQPYLVTITKHNYIPYIKNPTDVYIQNETILNDKFVFANNIYLGENVTNTKAQGQVFMQSSSNILLNASNDVYLNAGFEMLAGTTFEIK